MVTVQMIVDSIQKFAPFESAENWDNVGLLIGSSSQVVNKLMLALDITNEVIDEAIDNQVDVILSHHPLIFSSLKSIVESQPLGSSIQKLIRHNISVIAAHTNIDQSPNHGINQFLGQILSLKAILPLSDQHGFGIVGSLSIPMRCTRFIDHVKTVFHIDHVKIANIQPESSFISKVAICSGASSEFIHDALRAQADVYIMGDLKYHEAQTVLNSSLMLMDIGHYESEKIYLPYLKNLLEQTFEAQQLNIAIQIAKSERPIFSYL